MPGTAGHGLLLQMGKRRRCDAILCERQCREMKCWWHRESTGRRSDQTRRNEGGADRVPVGETARRRDHGGSASHLLAAGPGASRGIYGKGENSVFGGCNPYTTRVSGDWFVGTITAHTGDVYLDHKSMYEVTEKERVFHPVRSAAAWDPAFSVYVWYTERDSARDETVFFANFHEVDPNAACVECSVRNNCFLPEKTGISYITLQGFVIREAATQWAPPTAYQDGMVGPHWSKGWVIEDCEIAESKCSGISLGKLLQPENDNKWQKEKTKDGTQTERDCICRRPTRAGTGSMWEATASLGATSTTADRPGSWDTWAACSP